MGSPCQASQRAAADGTHVGARMRDRMTSDEMDANRQADLPSRNYSRFRPPGSDRRSPISPLDDGVDRDLGHHRLGFGRADGRRLLRPGNGPSESSLRPIGCQRLGC